MASEMSRLIERHGGTPLVVPAMREIPVPLRDNANVFRLGAKLMLQQVDMLILMTGVGASALFETLQKRHALPDIIAAMKHVIVVTRGPKPLAALKTLGMGSNITVPEPNTWQDVIATLDYYRPVKGLRVVVQEYGSSNPEMIRDLVSRGAEVFPVTMYRWALPEDLGSLERAVARILEGTIDVLLITNAAQIDHVMQLVERDGRTAAFLNACRKLVIASIGPTASERIKHYNLTVDLEPSHPKMGILVKETAMKAGTLVSRKRGG
ncbi:uroporphyrinogen-III synthase [Nitrospira sp. KM1]|uniref:uroporphyrinogen-III synthase n=1 Tax=Nitrospira sp. KM1 TaxID=1936990 RepID=UPI001566D9AA|nr:uroporphyrinogen-III synthase [Nitrospira sp. KM1]